jgi:hypothetical protein
VWQLERLCVFIIVHVCVVAAKGSLLCLHLLGCQQEEVVVVVVMVWRASWDDWAFCSSCVRFICLGLLSVLAIGRVPKAEEGKEGGGGRTVPCDCNHWASGSSFVCLCLL